MRRSRSSELRYTPADPPRARSLTDSEVSPALLVLLTRLIVFAPQNDDVKFIHCLLYRLDALAQSMRDPAALVDFAKLLILQRPSEVEAALGQQPRQDFEAPFINTLIDTVAVPSPA